jgi:hypothetical protein
VAAARKSQQDVEDVPDALVDEEDGFAEDDDVDDEDAFEPDEVFAADDDAEEDLGEEELEAEEVLEASPDPDGDAEVSEGAGTVAPPPEATFDDEEDDKIVSAVTGEDDDVVDGLREGEFVCRSCYMAKRDTQLADPEQLLCRDCA